ncbi:MULTISPECIES: ABC transporter ATP-binding protein [Pseudonocardia]|uniref:Macrolide export ATP-binding/permease protein MacB n=2 Tax=Pseudonocardia TaxID=1847 RepID=A0A1Y2N0A9_PSEAH|nr:MULTISPECIES: ABC transporter ATP-binding protein [Pseudonocardia]OSY40338.1 Macrolide export ATP-binding/permease protein MacB [Pseudonocardia autotrophica]TDN72333.1 putative ABC transport system ATP-binding protein [Pseudonocardia autotrophica]BBG03044.1 ABC transporter ATP-binding protein [Pseudonocardia autotrophica]GEC23666.1 ABC transporter ATP-binding protein [Pseudonocardia saturnea]
MHPTPSKERPPALELVALRRLHRSTGSAPVHALDDVSLRLYPGILTALMGPSGSGKSTLLHCAAGLDTPTSGRVLLGGTDVGALSERRRTLLRRERIGVVFQAYNLVASLTAAQNIALPARLAGRRVSAGAVRAALDTVGLADRAAHRPAQLSGGQQQRVAIARAVLTRTEVLVADEPTGSLDSSSAAAVLALLRRCTEQGTATLLVTHDPVAAARADEVVVLRDGRVADRFGVPDTSDAAATIAQRLAGIGASR